jgi:hypothetical protein
MEDLVYRGFFQKRHDYRRRLEEAFKNPVIKVRIDPLDEASLVGKVEDHEIGQKQYPFLARYLAKIKLWIYKKRLKKQRGYSAIMKSSKLENLIGKLELWLHKDRLLERKQKPRGFKFINTDDVRLLEPNEEIFDRLNTKAAERKQE